MKLIKFRGKDNHGKWYFGGITSGKKIYNRTIHISDSLP